jgi:hypothetical protein
MARIPCVYVILGEIHKPCHFRILGSTSPLGDVIVPHHFDSLGFGTSVFFILAHFQFSQTLNPKLANLSPHVLLYRMTNIHFESSPKVHRSTPCVLLNMMAMFYFGASDFGDLKLQPFSLKKIIRLKLTIF